jgi:hypothetical protein
MKRESWLKDEQTNILKHSEIDHIFNSKLTKNVYNYDALLENQSPIVNRLDLS